jgi:hypothetical protein
VKNKEDVRYFARLACKDRIFGRIFAARRISQANFCNSLTNFIVI